MDLSALKQRFPMGLASTAMDLDDFQHLAEYEKNGISELEVTPIVTDNKAWRFGDQQSTLDLITLCKRHQVKPHSVHSFYMTELGHDMADADPDIRQQAIQLNRSVFDAAAELGAAYVVVHLYNETVRRTEGEIQFYAREALKQLLPAAERTGIRIAVENLYHEWTITRINQLLDEFNHPLTGICLDTGHAAMYSTPHEELERCGKRLLGFHIHDNHRHEDDHLVPFRGQIDWQAFSKALVRNGYQGTLMYEAFSRNESETVGHFIEACRHSYHRLIELIALA